MLGPLGVGGSGGTSLGVSYGGSLLDISLYIQFQASGMIGSGVFAGVGISDGGGPDAVSSGITSTDSMNAEVNVGVGPGGASLLTSHCKMISFRVADSPGFCPAANLELASALHPELECARRQLLGPRAFETSCGGLGLPNWLPASDMEVAWTVSGHISDSSTLLQEW